MKAEHFHFYFRQARAWMEWGVCTANASKSDGAVQSSTPLKLRFDGQMTRKMLPLFEPDGSHSTSELEEALQEIAADALPIFQSPACVDSNSNVKPELCYYEVGETELPQFIALMRQLGKRRAQFRREQLLKVDTQTVPATPIPSAPSSPLLSQRVKADVSIFTAVANASVEDAIFLQERGVDLAAVEPKMQRNALHLLAYSTESYRFRAEMLRFLLNANAILNVNAVDVNGDAPLMLYASLGHLEFMKTLLKHGADIQTTNRKGQNVLHRACEKDQVEICGFLQQLMLKDSISEEDARVSEFAATISLHTSDNTGQFPLHVLVEKGFVECAKQLLVPTEANYEWNRVLQAQGDAHGRTPLHLAVLMHDAAMTAFLLTPGGGANVNAFDELHRAPVHFAVESPAALPLISRLVQHGADLNVADERGDTPLHWAVFAGRAAIVQHLLSLGADPTLVNSDWETPAQIAAAYGQLDCMRLLLQAQRRLDSPSKGEPAEQRPQSRPASEKTVLQRLEEAKQAARSYHDTRPDAVSASEPGAEQSRGYWEELHQDVQLVEESGQFSSEDEEDLLFGRDSDDDTPPF